MKTKRLTPSFVEYIPESINEGTIYISMAYTTATHKCACGCGTEIVTPISPTGWQLYFDGERVTLTPSIGNWSLPCRSHYLIVKNEIRVAGQMSREAIDIGRIRDKRQRIAYYNGDKQLPRTDMPQPQEAQRINEQTAISRQSLFEIVLSWFRK